MLHSIPFSRQRRRLLAAAVGCALPACSKSSKSSATAPAVLPASWLLTPGAPPPDWSKLDPWQGTITRDYFVRLLEDVLSNGKSWFRHIDLLDQNAALIQTSTPRTDLPRYELRFAPPGSDYVLPGLRFWRRSEELPLLMDPARPLDGVHIAIDPGHIGGSWAQMEERWFQSGHAPPVKEGELTLRTARVLAPLLENLGARISHVRATPEPMTTARPEQLLNEARASLAQEGRPVGDTAVQHEAERLFYRSAEIRARGSFVNDVLRPDLVLCLHFNAVPWGDPNRPAFSKSNHLHVLAHGCIGGDEFMLDDQRLDGLLRLLQRVPDVEIPMCIAIARRMAEATSLPPHSYADTNARMVPGEPYVWMRNLLANRIYQCPVVYLEPYVMNNAGVFERIRAGDYEGTASIAGKEQPSIFREYASGVAAGLADFFSARQRA